MSDESDSLIEQHGTEGLPVLKKIAAARGKLQGNFYFAGDSKMENAGVVLTLTARDP